MRFHGTPASIQLNNEDLIDDVKDAVFRKYPVALGRVYDSPDVSICLVTPSTISATSIESKVLPVDETIGDLLRHHFPGGQGIENALVVQVPGEDNALGTSISLTSLSKCWSSVTICRSSTQ
ncbi:Two-component response regulator [Taphrina deformans PYCC 5710]|uniref:Two-component response regulator n=1 Tax=Taphrina deformans (strain PYCC 5710 / ATCC 11124 / CBS 356.35 / IMI 108563 / JCM 9778 / NBRC 8474) TaxID=1097556 RepID=R4X9Z0_TAPDE|nr:Two-component response regulator [Taphrina deformans PYCC 5710]|eukprot:CCG82332.1 Two-component response regulator [Taphrina deformans PYCC 5710]